MNTKYKYVDGQRIYFELGNDNLPKGFGRIRGSVSHELPGIGRTWIVEVEDEVNLNKDTYPFKCIAVFDVQIKDPPAEFMKV